MKLTVRYCGTCRCRYYDHDRNTAVCYGRNCRGSLRTKHVMWDRETFTKQHQMGAAA